MNRSYNKSDYIPAIAWGRNAKFCRDISVARASVSGDASSRVSTKKLSEEDVVTKMAYEVSIGKMDLCSTEE